MVRRFYVGIDETNNGNGTPLIIAAVGSTNPKDLEAQHQNISKKKLRKKINKIRKPMYHHIPRIVGAGREFRFTTIDPFMKRNYNIGDLTRIAVAELVRSFAILGNVQEVVIDGD